MARITKVTEALTWQSLKSTFFIGVRVTEQLKRDKDGKVILRDGEPIVVKVGKQVNELQEAVEDGTLDKLVSECADKLHGGDVQSVYVALSRNLDSVKSNRKKANTLHVHDATRLETLYGFIKARRIKKAGTSGRIPQWAYGPKEIDKIDDPERLRRVINSIADVCSDKPGGNYTVLLGENYVEVAKANREYARKRMALLESPVMKVDDATLEKLSKGGKVVLSADQAAELLKLLKG